MAADNTNTRVIIDVSLNARDATQESDRLAESIKAVKEEQKQLKAEGKELSTAYVSNAQTLRQLVAEQKAYIAISGAAEGSNNQLRAQLALLTQQYNALGAEERDGTLAGKALTIQIKAISDTLKVNESAIGDNRRNVGNYKEAIVSSKEALEEQKAALSAATTEQAKSFTGFKQFDDVIGSVTNSVKAVNQALAESKAAQVELKAAQALVVTTQEAANVATERATAIGFQFAAGEATAAEAEAARTVATESQIVATGALTAATEAQTTATAASTNAAKVFKIALASTGIGAIIIIVAALISYLSKFDPIMDKVEQAFAVVGSIITRVTDIVVNFFSNISSLGDFLSKIGGILADPIGSFKRLGDEIATTARAAVALKKAQQDLEDQVKIQEVSNARAIQQVRELTIQARNRTLSEQQRQALLQKANKIDNDNFKNQQNIANEKKKIALEDIRINANLTKEQIKELDKRGIAYAFQLKDTKRITDDQVDALKEAELEKIKNEEEVSNRREKNLNLQDALAEKSQAEAEKRAARAEELRKKAQEADQERLDSLLRTNAGILSAREKEIASINREIDEKVEKYRKYGRTTAQLELERTARLKQIAEEYHARDVEQIKNNNREIEDIMVESIRNEGEKRIAQIDLNKKRELEKNDEEIQALLARIIAGDAAASQVLQSVTEKRQAIIKASSEARRQAVYDEYTTDLEAYNQHQVDLANAKLIGAGSDAEKLLAEQVLLEAQYQQQIDNATRIGQDTTLIAAQYADQKKQIDEKVNTAALNSIKNFSAAFQGTLKENTVAYKIAGAIQAKVDAAQALRNNILIVQENIKALSAQGKLPFPANIIAIASTLAALAGGVAAAKTLVTPVALAKGGVYNSDGKGGVLPGYSKVDNTNAFLRSGEAVIVSEAARDPRGLAALSAINVAYGGRPLAPGYAMASGGIAEGSYVSAISAGAAGQLDIVNAVIAGVTAAPAPIVDVRDITTAQQRNNAAVVNANL